MPTCYPSHRVRKTCVPAEHSSLWFSISNTEAEAPGTVTDPPSSPALLVSFGHAENLLRLNKNLFEAFSCGYLPPRSAYDRMSQGLVIRDSPVRDVDEVEERIRTPRHSLYIHCQFMSCLVTCVTISNFAERNVSAHLSSGERSISPAAESALTDASTTYAYHLKKC